VIPAKHEVPAASVRAPVLQTRTCVADALRLPAGLEGSLPGEVALNVQVADDGRPSDVAFPGNIDPRLRAALLSAVRTCRFAPAQDAGGRAAPGRATIRLRFEP
jgi:TonB family protein